MKSLLILTFSLPFTHGHLITKRTGPDTCYFYCVARAIRNNNLSTKQTIMYTSVQKITCDQKAVDSITQVWTTLVNQRCGNPGGCTSDVNYYATWEAANRERQKTKALYSDTTHYTAQQVNVQ
jgi:hypothetical protein